MSAKSVEFGLENIPTKTKVTHIWRIYVALMTTILCAIVPLGFIALQSNVRATIAAEIKPFLTIERYGDDGRTRERIAELERDAVTKRLDALERIVGENRRLIDANQKEIVEKLQHLEVAIARRNTKDALGAAP
jgi:hypothetical protein